MSKSARILVISFCALLQFFNSSAQNTSNIYIVAKDDGKPVALATLFFACSPRVKQQVQSNAQGLCVVAEPLLACSVSVTALGYETQYGLVLAQRSCDTIYCIKKNSQLQELVITGQPQKIAAEKSIYKVFSITEKTLKQQASVTLSDAINNELGFYRQQDNLLGSATNLGGIGGQNIKVLVNGVPVNGRENGNIDLNQINVANAERIEIVKGPMSVLYGTDALGGVINVIAKNAKQTPSFALNTYAESINKMNAGIEASGKKGKHGLYINLNRNFFGGYQYTDSFNRAQLWKPKVQYTADLSYSLQLRNCKLSYTPTFMWEKIVNKGTPIVDPFAALVNDELITTRRLAHAVTAEVTVDSNTKITFNNSISNYHRLRTRVSKDLAQDEEAYVPHTTGLDTSNFVDYNFRCIGNSKLDNSTSIAYGYDVNVQTASSLKLLNTQQHMQDYAVFASVPFSINPKFEIQPAIRLSYNTKYYVPAIPSLNIKLDLPKKTILRASYAQGFRAPSLKELFLEFVDINHNVLGNALLKPERGTHVQASIEAPLYVNQFGKLNVVYAGYYNSISNQIALALRANTNNEYLYVNVGEFKNFVQDLRLQYWSKRWSTQVGASLNNIARRDSLSGFSTWEMMCRANYLVGKYNTGFNFVYRYIGTQPILSVTSTGSGGFTNAYLPVQHLADINISQSFLKEKLFAQVGVKNLLDVTSLAIQGNTQGGIHNHGTTQYVYPDRSIFVSMRFRW
jgi:outer membrane receptor for ferrienterochelin and colicins